MSVNSKAGRDRRADAGREAERYVEWLVDESIRMSFPASDPASTSQPGSAVYERYVELDRRYGKAGDA